MAAQHLTGPWEYRSHPHRDVDNALGPVCGTVAHIKWDQQATKSDKRLIVAAPETAAERDRLKAINAELLAVLRDTWTHLEAIRKKGQWVNSEYTSAVAKRGRIAIVNARKDEE